MNELTLTQTLINELLNSYNNYLTRIDNNNGTREHHFLSEVNKHRITTAAKVIGGLLFFAPIVGPGLGNLIKEAGPAGTEAIVNLLHYERLNKKIDNAGKVIDYVGNNPAVFFQKIAGRIIEQRQDLINNLPDTTKAQKRVAKYLAANILASVKHDVEHANESFNAKVNYITNDLENTRSKKVFDEPNLKLKQFAKHR
jgi:hypothetical protein